MLTNSSLTVYHKGTDSQKRTEVWERFNYDKVWFFGKLNSRLNDGYENANSVQIRIPYNDNKYQYITAIVVKTIEKSTFFYNFRRKSCKNRANSGRFLQSDSHTHGHKTPTVHRTVGPFRVLAPYAPP